GRPSACTASGTDDRAERRLPAPGTHGHRRDAMAAPLADQRARRDRPRGARGPAVGRGACPCEGCAEARASEPDTLSPSLPDPPLSPARPRARRGSPPSALLTPDRRRRPFDRALHTSFHSGGDHVPPIVTSAPWPGTAAVGTTSASAAASAPPATAGGGCAAGGVRAPPSRGSGSTSSAADAGRRSWTGRTPGDSPTNPRRTP